MGMRTDFRSRRGGLGDLAHLGRRSRRGKDRCPDRCHGYLVSRPRSSMHFSLALDGRRPAGLAGPGRWLLDGIGRFEHAA